MESGAGPALIVIDVQCGMDDPKYGERNNPGAEGQIAALLERWRGARWPVVHVQHRSRRSDSPFRPDSPGFALKSEVQPQPGEPLFQKSASCAFIGTALEDHLRGSGIGTVVLTGMMTDHCVSSTARVAADLGFDVLVVADATATFERTDDAGRHFGAAAMHDSALASLHGEFARVVDAEQLPAVLHLPAAGN